VADKPVAAKEISLPQVKFEYHLRERSWLERRIGPEWYRLIKGLVTNPLSVTGLIITAFFILIAVFAPVLAPPLERAYDPYLIPRDGYAPEPKPPGTVWNREPPPVPGWYRSITGQDHWVHLLGTTSGQFDIYYGVVWGTRTALFVGVLITAVTVVIGLIVGALSAYYGGWLDDLLMRITEVFLAFPFLLAALTLSATIALITFGWMTFARMLRGEILAAKERDYVMAARVVGARGGRVLMRHIVPNAIYPILILASMRVGDYVLSFATLSFLGVGTEIGYADWGQIVSFARDWILSLDTHWYIIVCPGVALLLFGLGWNLIGDALRDILDPRLRSTRG
jgi:peptide/nickel transport system permease protein